MGNKVKKEKQEKFKFKSVEEQLQPSAEPIPFLCTKEKKIIYQPFDGQVEVTIRLFLCGDLGVGKLNFSFILAFFLSTIRCTFIIFEVII